MSLFGRRPVEVGDRVAIDTPYLNGTAHIIDGPNYQLGTKVFPKYLFQFEEAVLVDPETGYIGSLTKEDTLWLEDNAKYISIFGVDDENISGFANISDLL